MNSMGAVHIHRESDLRYIQAEYSLQFLDAVRMGCRDRMMRALADCRERGGLPGWLMEYNRNMLNSCEKNAILFTGSDADTIAAWYLQYIEKHRADVTLVPIGLLNQPWFIYALKEKRSIIPKCVSINWTLAEINNIDAWKWHDGYRSIFLSKSVQKKYNIMNINGKIHWSVAWDIYMQKGSYNVKNLVALLHIIKSNGWHRPIYFSRKCNSLLINNLKDYLKIHGLVFKLFPCWIGQLALVFNKRTTDKILLEPNNFIHIQNTSNNKIPEMNSIIDDYLSLFIAYSEYNVHLNNKKHVSRLLSIMRSTLMKHFITDPKTMQWLEELEEE